MIKRLSNTLVPKDTRTGKPAAKVTNEPITGVQGPNYQVAGVFLKGSVQLKIGDVVRVEWKAGRPWRIIDFEVRRGGAADDPPEEGTGIVEQLFVGQQPGRLPDVYFRNQEQITRLNVSNKIGGVGPYYLGWGLKPHSFFVCVGDRENPGSTFKIHVFTLLVGGTTRQRKKAVGKKGISAVFNKTWQITDIVSGTVTLAAIHFRGAVTGLYDNTVPAQTALGETVTAGGAVQWFETKWNSGANNGYDFFRDSMGFNPSTVALEAHSPFFPQVPYPFHWEDDLDIDFADMRIKGYLEIGDIVLNENLDLFVMLRADVEGRRTDGPDADHYPRESKLDEGTKFQGTGVASPNDTGADKFMDPEVRDFICRSVGLKTGARYDEGTTVYSEDPWTIKPGTHYFLLNLTTNAITWRTLKANWTFFRKKRFVFTSEPINFSNTGSIGLIGSDPVITEAFRWNPGLLGDSPDFDPPDPINTSGATGVPFATHTLATRFFINSAEATPGYRVQKITKTFTFVIPTTRHITEHRIWNWNYRWPSHIWEFAPARYIGKRGVVPSGTQPDTPVSGWIFIVAYRRALDDSFVYTPAPVGGNDGAQYNVGNVGTWTTALDIAATANEDTFVGPTPHGDFDVFFRAINTFTGAVLTLIPNTTILFVAGDTNTLYPSSEFHLQWIRNGSIYISSLRGTELTALVGTDEAEFLEHRYKAIRPDQFFEAVEPAGKFIKAWDKTTGVVTLDQALPTYPPVEPSLSRNGQLKTLPGAANLTRIEPLIDTTSYIAIDDRTRTKLTTIVPTN